MDTDWHLKTLYRESKHALQGTRMIHDQLFWKKIIPYHILIIIIIFHADVNLDKHF